jgi:hypothetical protein
VHRRRGQVSLRGRGRLRSSETGRRSQRSRYWSNEPLKGRWAGPLLNSRATARGTSDSRSRERQGTSCLGSSGSDHSNDFLCLFFNYRATKPMGRPVASWQMPRSEASGQTSALDPRRCPRWGEASRRCFCCCFFFANSDPARDCSQRETQCGEFQTDLICSVRSATLDSQRGIGSAGNALLFDRI